MVEQDFSSTPVSRVAQFLTFSSEDRRKIWAKVANIVDSIDSSEKSLNIENVLAPNDAIAALTKFDFLEPHEPSSVLEFVSSGLTHGRVHTTHPGYYGLFNPAVGDMGIVADTLTAAFNPQLASWNHGSFPISVEDHLVRHIGERLGLPPKNIDGVFTSGGAEANHTAVLTALTKKFRGFSKLGLRGLPAQPTAYISREGHHSFRKAIRACGLGTDALTEIPVDVNLKMDIKSLRQKLDEDRKTGKIPFLIVATAGTTSGGIIDPLSDVATVCKEQGVWFHVDAAWGGAAAIVPEMQHYLSGIEQADSVTFDAHKWLSVPMAAGMFLTTHPDILGKTFHIETDYMPPEGDSGEINPYHRSLQWSRRFIGLKVFMSLAVAGWNGYATVIRQQTKMGVILKKALALNKWRVVNNTPLPVACFIDATDESGFAKNCEAIVKRVVDDGRAWVSMTKLNGLPVIRACVTNFKSQSDDIQALITALNHARSILWK